MNPEELNLPNLITSIWLTEELGFGLSDLGEVFVLQQIPNFDGNEETLITFSEIVDVEKAKEILSYLKQTGKQLNEPINRTLH